MSPVAVPAEAACPDSIGVRSNRSHHLTDVEAEILVRLVGYGCTPEKAARYLERPATLIIDELKRMGFAASICGTRPPAT